MVVASLLYKNLIPVVIVSLAKASLPDYLSDCVDEGTSVDWKTKKRFCCEIADGLLAMHQVGIVHGDIKGNNILLFTDESEENTVVAKISDFGYSATKESIKNGGGTGGTRPFLAPECTLNAPPPETKVLAEEYYKDKYSYGLLVWQIAKNGDMPFIGMRAEEIDNLKHIDKKLCYLIDDLEAGVPEKIKSVIAAKIPFLTDFNLRF